MPPSPNRPRGKAKVKTGCRTCKIRKVKCDEARPSCQRCISTGRKCDGYGVWDSPAQHETHTRIRPDQSAPLARCHFSPLPMCTPKERQYFEWFVSRTVYKLPGTFLSSFWTNLLLQATVSEHAVFHAVLALGCMHKDGSYELEISQEAQPASQEERFVLQHYLQSIGHLKAYFSSNDRRCVRVVLISCIIFVCLDFIQGNFESGQSHLRSGLRVLDISYTQHGQEDTALYRTDGETTEDGWILEIFTRLRLMAKLFPGASCPMLIKPQLPPVRRCEPTLPFQSLKHAWKKLQSLLDEVFTLEATARLLRKGGRPSPASSCADLLEYQQSLCAELEAWPQACQYLVDQRFKLHSEAAQMVRHLIFAYHHMASIMAHMALRADGEAGFDEHTQLFALIIEHMCRLRMLASAESSSKMHDYISDVGWIAPLCYTAIHCRNHRIRTQAVRLLESGSHREGIWDSTIMACVTRKIVALEEGDYYSAYDADDEFDLTSQPSKADLALPTLPQPRRLRDVEVILLGTPLCEIRLFCTRLEQGMDRRILLSKSSVHAQGWTDCCHSTRHVESSGLPQTLTRVKKGHCLSSDGRT